MKSERITAEDALNFKIQFINNSTDKYFIETWNPLTKLCLMLTGRPVTKEEYKKRQIDKLMQEYNQHKREVKS
jgi:hypothetical protein